MATTARKTKIAELEKAVLKLKLYIAEPVIVVGDTVPQTDKEPVFDAKKSYEGLRALVTLQETRLEELENCIRTLSLKLPKDPVTKTEAEAPLEKQGNTVHKKHKPPVYTQLELTIKDMIVKYFLGIKQDYVPISDYKKCYQAILTKTNCEPRHIDFTMGKMSNEFILEISDDKHVVFLNRGLENSILRQLVLVLSSNTSALPEGELITELCSRTSHCTIIVKAFINVWLKKGFITLLQKETNGIRIINCTRHSMIEDYIKQ